jgi:membrane associated rhomboid family serine protease
MGAAGAHPRFAMRRLPIVSAVLIVALASVPFAFQHGQPSLGVWRSIEFRCNAIEYGLIPYEITHPGAQLTDPYCQAQPESLLHGDEEPAAGGQAHDHPRTDPGIIADAPTWLTPLTATFMHGSLLHLAASVLALLIFGPRLERRLGRSRTLALFVLGAVASSAALILLAPNLPIATIGATGAVAALVGGHVALWPRARLTPFELPAFAVAAGWLLLDAAIADQDAAQPVAGAGGDIAYLTPAAGLIVGLLLGLLVARRSQPTAPEVRPCPTSALQS